MDRESRPDLPQPLYEMHGFLVCEPGALREHGISSRWGNRTELPISRLVIVEIDHIDELVREVFERASKHIVADLGPHPDILAVESEEVELGLSSPLAIDLRDPPAMDCVISRSALWYLADRDGLGTAAASNARYDDDPATRVLSALLIGKTPDENDVALTDLDSFVDAVVSVWRSPSSSAEVDKEIVLAGAQRVEAVAGNSARLQLSAEAIAYRLQRHLYRLVSPHLRTMPLISRTIEQVVERGAVALWPSQASVLSSGLLKDPACSFIVQLATSAGKTLLIALSCAVALDQQPAKQVVVVASTRALVRQLRRELERWLPEVSIAPVLGEMEFSGENCFPDGGVPGRVVVTTPERLDLDWRRAVTESSPINAQRQVALIVADEAHLLADSTRGPRLEGVLARALRYNIPIQLFSSQLGDLDQLSVWLAAESADNDWQPADVEQSAFYRSADESQGFLMGANREPQLCMTMPGGKWDRSDPNLAQIENVSSMAAGLALSRYEDGTVLLYTAQKRWAQSIANAVNERANGGWEADPALKETADGLPPSAANCARLLRKGIGVHHASSTTLEQRAVERAAEQRLLRFLICTDTLLAGVDFPIRTVIVVHRFRGQGLCLPVRELRNLAGRAGRGGRFSSGDFIVMTRTEAEARSLLQDLSEYEPPPTLSQLGRAVNLIESYRSNLDITPAESLGLRDLDAYLLRAVAEAALRQGDLRLELEKTLGRTLWWASAPEERRESLLDAAEVRAEALRSPAIPRGWNRVIYRTGLDRSSCNTLRERLEQIDASELEALAEIEHVRPEDSCPMLVQLALGAIQISPVDRTWPDALDSEEDRESTIQLWLSGGEPESPRAKSQERAFDYLKSYASWVVGASIEIIGWMHDLDSTQSSRLHANLGLDRLRLGAPSRDAAKLVDLGLPRVEAAALWNRYRFSDGAGNFLTYARDTLDSRTIELLGLNDLPNNSEPFEWPVMEHGVSGDSWDTSTASPCWINDVR